MRKKSKPELQNEKNKRTVKEYQYAHRQRWNWYGITGIMSTMAVVLTVYLLILPAITMERSSICGKEEHVHTEECYEEAVISEWKCQDSLMEIHQHTDACYDTDGQLICGYADFILHTHDAACYNAAGQLTCPLEEKNGKKESCEVHTHDKNCYVEEDGSASDLPCCGKLQVQEHIHDASCLPETESVLTCGLEEHQHTEDCYEKETTQETEAPEAVTESEAALENEAVAESETTPESEAFVESETVPESEAVVESETAAESEIAVENETVAESEIAVENETVPESETVAESEAAESETAVESETVAESEAATENKAIEENETVAECETATEIEVSTEIETTTETEIAVENETATEIETIAESEEVAEAETTTESEEVAEAETAAESEEVAEAETTTEAEVVTENETAAEIVTETEMEAAAEIITAAESEEAAGSAGMALQDDKIISATLSYKMSNSDTWTEITSSTKNIPGNAQVRLEIKYANILAQDLRAAGGILTYQLPELLRNPTADGIVTSGSTQIGTITADGTDTVTIVFDTAWLEKAEMISGDFYVEAQFDLSKFTEGQAGKIVIGNMTFDIDFSGDFMAKYANVDLEKSTPVLTEEDDGDYLNYTLKVTAGSDGCPDVKVVDGFTATRYIVEYVGATGTETSINMIDAMSETGADAAGSVYLAGSYTTGTIPDPAGENVTKPGILVWNIGDMGANEVRVLTYKVKLKDEYTGITTKGNIQNCADVYSKTYLRDSDVSTFTPSAGATMGKSASSITENEDGSYSITYTIWAQAYDTNTYTLDNVTIVDWFFYTDFAMNEYVDFVQDSFKLYSGKGTSGEQLSIPDNPNSTETEQKANPDMTSAISSVDRGDANAKHFTMYIGDLKPGEIKTLTYEVKISPGVFTLAGNESISLNNRAHVRSDNTRSDGNQKLNAYNCFKTIERKAWDRKMAGEQLENAVEVPMNGTTVTIPAGSYQYQVLVNEAGNWNVSLAVMKDELGNEHMQFVGYAKVEAYDLSNDTAPSSNLSDASAIAYFKNKQPVQTLWVDIDGEGDFEFTLHDIGGKEGDYAYILTYYAKPVNIEGVAQIVVDNSFSIGGTVGTGNYWFTLSSITVNATVMVEGDNSFHVEKRGWYYEAPQTDSGPYRNGKLNWAIKVDGSTIQKGTRLRDDCSGSDKQHFIWNDPTGGSNANTAEVAVYIGDLGEQSITDFSDMEAALASGKLTALDGSKYSYEKDTGSTTPNRTLILTFLDDIPLDEGESIYVIVKTALQNKPSAKRDAFTYTNKVQSSFAGETWLDNDTASMVLYGSKNIFKELGKIFSWDGTTEKTIQNGTSISVSTSGLSPGTYTSWQVHLNYEGTLSGRYRVIEHIPDGMELAYIRLYWRASGASSARMVRLGSQELEVIGTGWEECQFGSDYYYTNGQDALFDVSNLVPGGTRDAYAVEIQVVCRVTDQDVLIGGQTKEFNNTVELKDQKGDTIGTDSSGVTIGKTSLSKTGTYDSSVNGGKYPFKIVLNELGEDLVEGGDTITLIDELGSSLILDTSSISVVNSKTNEVIDDWKASISTGEKTVLKLKLPDNLPLTITYETSVNAAPGATVSISNTAHWEGYTAPTTADVEVPSFSYSAGGTVESNESPSLKILKKDKNNTSEVLSGATFTLQAVTYENGVYTPVPGSKVWTGTTGEDGSVTFGKSNDQVMAYNTIYCLKEIEAPEGYVLDKRPHYFAIGKKVNDVYQIFPEEVDVYYLGSEYTCEIYDRPNTYELPQTGGLGTEPYQKAGIFLVVTAALVWVVRKRII